MPQTPRDQVDEGKYQVELTYDIISNGLTMKSKCPTVILGGILKKAEASQVVVIAETGAARRVIIDYDMLTDAAVVRTDASPLILRGILSMAHSMMTQSQVFQRIQAMGATSRIQRPS